MKIRILQALIDKIRGKKAPSLKRPSVFVSGKNNEIYFAEEKYSNLELVIRGNNNKVIIKAHKHLNAYIEIGLPDLETDNCEVIIEEGTTSNSFTAMICEDNSKLHIGKNCMLSAGINLFLSDTHTIVNENDEIINIGKNIEIGDHCWIGTQAVILKNTTIAPNTIVGAYSIVSGTFNTPNCIIAGNPAKIKKEKINWNRMRPKEYLEIQNNQKIKV